MFLLLSGKSPFKGSTYDEVVMRNYHCKVDYPSVENKVTQNCRFLLFLFRFLVAETNASLQTIK